MPAISDYEDNATTHALYTRIANHFFVTDLFFNKYVAHAARETAVEMEQRLHKATATLCDACWQEHPSVMAQCLRGW